MFRRTLGSFLIVAAALLMGACHDSPIAPGGPASGFYLLESLGGSSLPVAVQTNGAQTTELVDGFLFLSPPSTFALSTTTRVSDGTTTILTTVHCPGAYSVRRTMMTLTTVSNQLCPGRLTATWTADELRIQMYGMTSVFRFQNGLVN